LEQKKEDSKLIRAGKIRDSTQKYKPPSQKLGTARAIDESIISIFYIIFNLVLSRFKSILFYYYFLLSYLMN